MNQLATIQHLTSRLRQIESEIVAIRHELKALPAQGDQLTQLEETPMSGMWVDKRALKKQMRQLFLTMSVQGETVGIDTLQKQMREAGLASNELSQSIISAREE